MKKCFFVCLVLVCTSQIQAQPPTVGTEGPKPHRRPQRDSLSLEERKKFREKNAAEFQQMSPAEKEKRKAEMKAKMANMTPEEKEKARAAMKARYQDMSPEEKARVKQRMGNPADSSAPSRRHKGHRPPRRQF